MRINNVSNHRRNGNAKSLAELRPGYLEFIERSQNDLSGYRTGIFAIDNALDGVQGYFVLGGVPGIGKTSLFIDFCIRICSNHPDVAVLFIELEMDKNKFLGRVLSNITKLPYILLRHPNLITDSSLKEVYSRGLEQLYSLKFDIFCRNSGRLNFQILRSEIRHVMEKHQVQKIILVIDSIQKFPTGDRGFTDLISPVSYIDSQLLAITQEFENVTILAVSQQSKEGFGKSELHTFAWSMDLAYSAETCAFLISQGQTPSSFRDSNGSVVYNPNYNTYFKQYNLEIRKSKYTANATIPLKYYPAIAFFEEDSSRIIRVQNEFAISPEELTIYARLRR